MSAHEIVHLAGPDGERCSLCGARVAAVGFAYPPGARVAVVDGDAGSWHTQRRPTCPYEREVRP
jgi:hypothetical protein